MRDIDNVIIFSSEYIMLKIIVRDIFEGRAILDKLRKQIYIVDELKINMLLKSDILSSEKMMINYHYEVLILHCCRDMIVTMTVISIKQKVNRMIQIFIKIVIPIYFNIMIFVRFRDDNNELFKNRDYMFFSYQQISSRFNVERNILSHIINVNMCVVQINNILDISIIIDKNFRLNIVYDYEKEEYYAMIVENNHLTARNN